LPAKTALIVGASGLIGSHCLDALLKHPAYARVESWARGQSTRAHPRLVQRQIDFERLQEQVLQADDVYCCLGTTIGVAGSQEAFRRVDYGYPLALAGLAAAAGASSFLLVSALGADAASGVFYNRVKGELERDIRKLGLKRWHFFRPSLLIGERAEPRLGERVGLVLGKVVGPLMLGGMAKYRPIKAAAVARAMVLVANLDRPSGAIESDEIAALVRA
jgi:uncharacterized protein YbjT (DUF2867 family)